MASSRFRALPHLLLCLVLGAGLFAPAAASAQATISATERYAYGANIGWVDARPSLANGARVTENVVSGYLYSANVGWIHLGDGSPANARGYGNVSGADYGVNVAAYRIGEAAPGALSGYAYGANIGWIVFDPLGAPRVNLTTGRLSGYVYSANVGWISLGEFSLSVATDTLPPAPDLDGDGLPDAWELEYFADLNVAGAFTDYDGDGVSDADEYVADTDPTNPADALRITAFSLDRTPSPDVARLTFTSKPTRRYSIEYTPVLTDPAAWTDSVLGWFAPDAGAATTRDVTTIDTPTVFLRVRAQRPLAP